MEILTLKDLSFLYPGEQTAAVSHVDLSIQSGEFVLLCGATGSGKSTLMRLLKRELAPKGQQSGEIWYRGQQRDALDARTASCEIGYVMQHPDMQLVTDKVWHELAFGLENMGYSRDVICRRVAEMANYFGIEPWFDRTVDSLSGGQKQLINLASVMAMQPKLLLLDEPTAQLDPIAASNFVRTLQKLNRELSLTIVIAEHRMEELMQLCDRVLVMDGGKLIADTAPNRLSLSLPCDSPLLEALPSATRVYRALESDAASGPAPLSEREGKNYIESNYEHGIRALDQPFANAPARKEILTVQDAYFRYERNAPDVLRGLSLAVREGESFCILGGNGAGKTTLLSVLAGTLRCYSGRLTLFGKPYHKWRQQEAGPGGIATLPQDVQTVFMRDTVREELIGCEKAAAKLPCSLEHLYDRHPYDLSGGEQQLVALARVLAAEPKILLLDEPTKGLDSFAKAGVLRVIRTLTQSGITVITVTHDIEFAARCADRCAMFFHGGITSVAPPTVFFAENTFYTTAAARMTREWFDGAVTVEDVVALCRLNGKKVSPL